MTGKELAREICGVISDKKGEEILIIDVAELTIVAEYYVICSGRSTPHVKALMEELEENMEKKGFRVLRKDGAREGRWVVLDYGNVIVHIFNNEERLFYNLEKLWSNGENCERYED